MARYLVQVSYNRQAVSDLIGHPQDRSVPIRQLVEAAGGKLETFDYSFGDYDVVTIIELPDNVTMAALSMAISAGGALRDFKTTVLLSMSEAVEAMRKASSIAYRPPAG